MKKMILTIAAVAATAVGMVIIDEIQRKGNKAVKHNTTDKVINKRTDEDKEAFSLLKEYKLQRSERDDRERTTIKAEVDEFKKSINYKEEKEKLDELVSSKVEKFKDSIGYQQSKEQFKKEYQDALDDWMKDHDYISRIQKEKDKIAEATKVAQNQKFLTSLTTDGSEFGKESAEKIKETIKEAEEKVKKECEKSIKEIEKEFEDYKKSAKKSLDENINELNKKVNAVRDEAVKETGASLRELNKSVSAKTEDIESAVKANRTDEEKEMDGKVSFYEKKVRDIQIRENEEIQKLLNEMDKTDVIAAYFKEGKWTRVGAACVMALPLTPVLIGGYYWIKMIVEVVDKMTEK